MHHVVWPIFVAAILPFVFTGVAKLGAFGRADNHQTRAWQATLTGYRQRAHWAHQNSFEALPIFAAAAILAGAHAPHDPALPYVCWGFIAARVGYGYLYITDRATARSVVWSLGMGACAYLFIRAGLAA